MTEKTADLRFLNHTSPPVTARSILDQASTSTSTSTEFRQLQALRDAEAWYVGTATFLRERLQLCEQLAQGLGEVLGLLGRIEAAKKDNTGEKSGLEDSAGEAKGVGIETEVVAVQSNVQAMEDAVETWLKDVRVANAKWIAGGRSVEKRIGLR